ncbi:MAG: SDR family NAD(P)-dependent oxidoreductase [Anaerolineales bacterium]
MTLKMAIVTGGGSGIGLHAARLLASEGFRVGLVGRRVSQLDSAAQSIRALGGACWYSAMDVRDDAAVTAFVNAAVAQYGKIDLLVNNAGMFRMLPFEKTTPEFWQENLDTNLTGAYNFCRAVWQHIDGGQIINVSSVAGVQPFPGCAAYSAAKYGLIGLSEVLALEGKARGIRVHVLAPANTDTPIWDAQAPAKVRARMMRPEQVAEVIRWLAVSPSEVTFDRLIIRPTQDPWRSSSS